MERSLTLLIWLVLGCTDLTGPAPEPEPKPEPIQRCYLVISEDGTKSGYCEWVTPTKG